MKTMTAQEFINAIVEDEQATTNTCIVSGFAKASDDSKGVILFSKDRNYTDWKPIPVDMIESVVRLGKVSCRDHKHERVQLKLKIPTQPEAAVFASLLSQEQSLRHVQRARTSIARDALRPIPRNSTFVSPRRDFQRIRSESCSYWCTSMWIECQDGLGGNYEAYGYGSTQSEAESNAHDHAASICEGYAYFPTSTSTVCCE